MAENQRDTPGTNDRRRREHDAGPRHGWVLTPTGEFKRPSPVSRAGESIRRIAVVRWN